MTKNQKLQAFAEREFAGIFDRLIIPDDSGGFMAFGKYRIVPDNQQFRVDTATTSSLLFSSKRSAISYCVADHNHQYNLANQISMLDVKKQALLADIRCRRQISDRSRSLDFAESVDNKIQRKMLYLDAINAELEKCLYSAKYIQIRGFSNETARTIHTFQNKANRQGV